MKIFIIGGSGSGKSYIARILSKNENLSVYELDDIQWDKNGGYGKKNPLVFREKLLNEKVKEKDWIIEGVYYKWTDIAIKNADYVFAVFPPIRLQTWRIIKRFIRRKLKIEKGHANESIKSVWKLIKWNREYNTVKKDVIIKKLEKLNKSNLYVLGSSTEILSIIKQGENK